MSTKSNFILHFQFPDHLPMFGMRRCGNLFPTDYGGNIYLQNMGKDFLRNAQFLSEISDVSWRCADEWFRGDVDAGFAQLPLYHADTLL